MKNNEIITSSNNAEIKRIKSLYKRKYREKYKEYLVEGLRIVEHGIANGLIKKLFVSEFFMNSEHIELDENSIYHNTFEVVVVSDKLFKEISDTESPQGIIGVVHLEKKSLGDLLKQDISRLLVLDKVQDPGNLGTMIRTADGAGFQGVILAKGSVDHLNPKVVRSAMGSSIYFPVYVSEHILEDISTLKAHDYKVYGTDLKTDFYYDDIIYPEKTCIIIGNEAKGVSEEVLELSDERIKIPLIGKAESLNASVAGSIIMYEVVRQGRKIML